MIGETILKRRKARGMSQAQLAAAIQVSYRQIQRWEKADYIEAHRLLQIAAALGLPLSAFLGDQVRELEGEAGLSAAERDLVERLRGLPEERREKMLPLLGADEGVERLVDVYLRLPEAERRQLLAEAGRIGITAGVVTWR